MTYRGYSLTTLTVARHNLAKKDVGSISHGASKGLGNIARTDDNYSCATLDRRGAS
jgi:hypothetical protein